MCVYIYIYRERERERCIGVLRRLKLPCRAMDWGFAFVVLGLFDGHGSIGNVDSGSGLSTMLVRFRV